MPGTDGLPRRRQRHIYCLRDEHGGVPFGTKRTKPLVVMSLDLAPREVHPLSGLGSLVLGQGRQRLARLGHCRSVAEMVRLGAGQSVEIACGTESVLGRPDCLGQRIGRQQISG